MRNYDLSGVWQCLIGGDVYPAQLSGTLDTNGIGRADLTAAPWHPDENCNEALAKAIRALPAVRICSQIPI